MTEIVLTSKVEERYLGCGHTERFTTPGVQDPAGMLLSNKRDPDDVIRIFGSESKCPMCRDLQRFERPPISSEPFVQRELYDELLMRYKFLIRFHRAFLEKKESR